MYLLIQIPSDNYYRSPPFSRKERASAHVIVFYISHHILFISIRHVNRFLHVVRTTVLHIAADIVGLILYLLDISRYGDRIKSDKTYDFFWQKIGSDSI